MTTLREKMGELILSFCEEREFGDCNLNGHRNKKEIIDAILEAVREEIPEEATFFSKEEVAKGWNSHRTAVLKVLEGR